MFGADPGLLALHTISCLSPATAWRNPIYPSLQPGKIAYKYFSKAIFCYDNFCTRLQNEHAILHSACLALMQSMPVQPRRS
jgi:hypothetical protein